MATGLGVFQNASLEHYNLQNTEATNTLLQRTFAYLDVTTRGGMVRGDSGNVGTLAGVIEEAGKDTSATALVGLAYIPVGGRARVRRRGITTVRCSNVAVTPGILAYAIPANGRVTSSSGGNTLCGVFLTETAGVLDELVVVDVNF